MVMFNHEIVGNSANEGPDVWHDQWDPEKVVKIFAQKRQNEQNIGIK